MPLIRRMACSHSTHWHSSPGVAQLQKHSSALDQSYVREISDLSVIHLIFFPPLVAFPKRFLFWWPFCSCFNSVFITVLLALFGTGRGKAACRQVPLHVGKWWNGTLAWLWSEAVWPLSPLKQTSIVLFSSNHNKWFIPQQTCIAVKQSYNRALIPYLRSWHDAKTRRQAFCKGSDSAKWHGPEQQSLSFPQRGVT